MEIPLITTTLHISIRSILSACLVKDMGLEAVNCHRNWLVLCGMLSIDSLLQIWEKEGRSSRICKRLLTFYPPLSLSARCKQQKRGFYSS